jgi:hypothetical protein
MGSEFGCVGGRRKTSKIGPLKKGLLSSTGYSVKKSLRSVKTMTIFVFKMSK